MKRIVLLLGVLFICTLAYSIEHLKFNGIELCCPISQFRSQMTSKGFEVYDKYDNMVIFNGTYTGVSGVSVVASCTTLGVVYEVLVIYPHSSIWPSEESRYVTLKNNLTQKYGQPYETKEYFTKPYSINNMPILALKEGKAEYSTTYTNEKGMIILSIGASESGKEAFVGLVYTDWLGSEMRDLEIKNEL